MSLISDWDKRYSNEEYGAREPSRFLVDMLPLPHGRALDIACGDGRNAIFLADRGYSVDAVDISTVAIEKGMKTAAEKGLNVNFFQADLEKYIIPENNYDLIVNFNYLQRQLVPGIIRGLKIGGVLIFETFTLEQQAIGNPRNPDFLLKPNELLRMFSGLHIFFYREGVFEEERRKGIASLAGRKV